MKTATRNAAPLHPYETGAGTPVLNDPVDELYECAFSSFTRADHHLKAEQYLRGLLTATGRKSIRNIARPLADSGASQRLHHFISNAPWNWVPVRQALAEHLTSVAPPEAWVVRSLLIPKSGSSSVGVHRRFVPEIGQTANGQQAHGMWYARRSFNSPVAWHLDVSAHRTPVTTVLDAVPPLAGPPPAARTPVLWDSRSSDAPTVLAALAESGLPAAVRLPATAVLRLPSRTPRGGPERLLTAERLVAAALPTRGTPVAPGVRAMTLPVRLPAQHTAPWGGGDGLALYAQRQDAGQRPRVAYWLTTMTDAPPARLHRLTGIAQDVARDCARVGSRVGLRDFEGRSYHGWHRHMTLASVAYTVAMLGGADGFCGTGARGTDDGAPQRLAG